MDNIIVEYRHECKERLAKRMRDRYGTKSVAILSVFALIFINLLAYFVTYKIWDVDTANQFIVGFLIGTVLLDIVMVIFPPIIWRFQEIPEEIHVESKNKLSEKDKEISELIEKSKLLTPQKVAFDMGLLTQEFEKNFMSITSNSNSQEIRRLFSFTGNSLDELIDTWLPKAKLVLKNFGEIEKNIYSLNTIRNQYGDDFRELLKLKEKLEEWNKTNDGVTPKEIREPLIKVFGTLWGVDENCCNVKMQAAINSCLASLRQNI